MRRWQRYAVVCSDAFSSATAVLIEDKGSGQSVI
jgi:hypothetical protein